jgi:hypothetical protein
VIAFFHIQFAWPPNQRLFLEVGLAVTC